MRTHSWIVALLAISPVAFGRQSGVAVQEAKLLGSDTAASNALGRAVAISGDTVVLGAPTAGVNERGAAYAFVRSGGAWSQQAKLSPPPGAFDDFDHFGSSVAIDADVAVVGAPDWGDEDGRACVFRRSAGAWTIEAVLGPPTTGYFYAFGGGVAVMGDTLAISAPKYGPTFEGAVAIYERIAGSWSFRSWIGNPDSNVDGDWMGEYLALSDLGWTRLLLTSTRVGNLIGFTESAGVWLYRYGFQATGAPIESLYLDGASLAFGAPNYPTNNLAGSGRVFTYRAPAALNQPFTSLGALSAFDPAIGARFGARVARAGPWLVVGASHESAVGATERGAAYVFERVNNAWLPRAKLVASDAASFDHFGSAVAVSSAGVIVGAPDASNTAGVDAGSVYAFRVGANAVTYCTAAPSSAGCVATITALGSPSASLATPFSIQVSGLDGGRAGLVFYGVSGPTSSPWNGASYACVQPPLQRTAVQQSGGAPQACDGSLALDWNSFQFQHPTSLGSPFSAGDECFAQAWIREPASPKSTHLSSALAFELQP